MDRRTFIKGAGGFVLLAAASAVLGTEVLTTALTPYPKETLLKGPLLRDELTFAKTAQGASAFVGDTEVFNVNATGAQLLTLADGTHTLDEIGAKLKGAIDPVEAALFYVEVGKAGYLQNRVEVALVEHTA